MCEVTWNTWGTCERSVSVVDANAWVIMHCRSFVFVVSFCCQLVSLSFDCVPCLVMRTLWLKFESLFTPTSYSCFMRTLSDLFDLSVHFISYLFISLIFLLFLSCLTLSTSLMVVDDKPAHFRWGAGPLGQKELLHMFLPVFLSYLFFFCLNLDFYLFLFHVDFIEARSHWHSANWESGPLANNTRLTGYEPNLFDDFHYSETTEIFLQEQSSDTMPSYLHDAELRDETIGRALSSPLFTQEREEPADRRQAYHSPEESLLSSQSLSVCHVRTVRPVSDQFDSLITNVREKPSRDSENQQIRILLEREKREQILADCRAEIQKHEFQADYERRSIQKLNVSCTSRRSRIRSNNCTWRSCWSRRCCSSPWWARLISLRWDSIIPFLNEMEELKRFQGSTFDEFFEKKIDRTSRHFSWTQGQGSGTTEWSYLYEWLERF